MELLSQICSKEEKNHETLERGTESSKFLLLFNGHRDFCILDPIALTFVENNLKKKK